MEQPTEEERPNMNRIAGGIYLVRTQAGFRKAILDFDDGDTHPSEVRGYPRKYPSVVMFYHGHKGYPYLAARCIPVNRLKEALKGQ